MQRRVLAWLTDGQGEAALNEELERTANERWRRASSLPTRLPALPRRDGWYWRGRTLDPIPSWRALKTPTLVVFGGADELLPADASAPTVRIGVDRGNGGQPQHRHTFVLDAATGAVQAWQPFSSQSTGQKARSWIRFLHTGEALGIVGQTIAGIVSLTSLLMAWTGLALAYRRLIVPLYSRRVRPSRV